jgi:hypothetical protein
MPSPARSRRGRSLGFALAVLLGALTISLGPAGPALAQQTVVPESIIGVWRHSTEPGWVVVFRRQGREFYGLAHSSLIPDPRSPCVTPGTRLFTRLVFQAGKYQGLVLDEATCTYMGVEITVQPGARLQFNTFGQPFTTLPPAPFDYVGDELASLHAWFGAVALGEDGGLGSVVWDEWVTTGVRPRTEKGLRLMDQRLGSVDTLERGENVPLNGCRDGLDQFLSPDPACEGKEVLGQEGYVGQAYGPQPAGTLPLYRCTTNGHFASTSADCGGRGRQEALLGYVVDRIPLVRWRNANDTWTTTMPVPQGIQLWRPNHPEWPSGGPYQRLGTLGYALPDHRPGTVPFYTCWDGSSVDLFLWPDEGCDGRTSRASGEGYLFSPQAPQPAGTVAVYRCATSTDRFASTDPGCEGEQVQGLLGYALEAAGDPEPQPTSATDAPAPAAHG